MYIDEKFKDAAPTDTIERIKGILMEMNIELVEDWLDTGVEHCYGLHVHGKNGFPFANGKGVTAEFACGSAYGEFIERLQSGLFLYKYQSLENDPELLLHTYAPDAKYVSKDELLRDSDWMQPIVERYGVSRESLADQCEMYAGSPEILVTPYYDLFGKRHVMLPAGFVEHIYSANGCCVGNTKEEAWIHALSEIMERYCSVRITSEDISVPKFTEETLRKFRVVSEILDQIRKDSDCDVEVLDCSLGLGYPVVATRLLNRKTHRYIVSIGADPILEIAIQRTLTEAFQGRKLSSLSRLGVSRILSHAADVDVVNNVLNQLETAEGTMNAAFFLPSEKSSTDFPDYSGSGNRELVQIVLEYFRKLGLPVYVRNYSFLGFPCYKFVIPGFSESRGLRLNQKSQIYAMGHLASLALRNMRQADDLAMGDVLMHHKMIRGVNSREYYYPFLAGLPMTHTGQNVTAAVHHAYAAYRLKRYPELQKYLKIAAAYCNEEDTKAYLECITSYLRFRQDGFSHDNSLTILHNLFDKAILERMECSLAQYGDVFSDLLIDCHAPNCQGCKHGDICHYQETKRVIGEAGKRYAAFIHGQDPIEFEL